MKPKLKKKVEDNPFESDDDDRQHASHTEDEAKSKKDVKTEVRQPPASKGKQKARPKAKPDDFASDADEDAEEQERKAELAAKKSRSSIKRALPRRKVNDSGSDGSDEEPPTKSKKRRV